MSWRVTAVIANDKARHRILRPNRRRIISSTAFSHSLGQFRKSVGPRAMSASLIGRSRSSAFRLSASAVSMSLAGSCFSSESAPGPFHHGIRRRGGTISTATLPSDNGRSKRTYELTSSIDPRGTSFHCSVDLGCPPIALILCALHAAAVSLVQRNSVPSTQMRCMITANRRARATIAFFIPRRRAICMAQALSQDHLFERSMLCAAS